MFRPVTHHSGQVGTHSLNSVDYLFVGPPHQVSNRRSSPRTGNQNSTQSRKVSHIIMDMGSYQITQSQGPDQLLPGTTELFGSHDDRKINRNPLISTTGISHHRFFTTVHPSIGSCGGTNQGIVQKVVFQQPFVDIFF